MKTKGFSKTHRKRKEPIDLDINSLLDILVILLVFLLKSYNPSDLFVDIPSEMKVPISQSTDLGRKFVTVKVLNEENIWIEDAKIDSTNMDGFLVKLKEERAKIKSSEDQKYLNLVMDGELPYNTIKKLMDVASEIGFEHFKLIVKAKEV